VGIEAICPKPGTSRANKHHKIYPYLLKDLKIDKPNQVWAADITYLPMSRGFAYLVATIDVFSRKILVWKLSNALDVRFCLEALNEAITRYGTPEIFNTDRGHNSRAKHLLRCCFSTTFVPAWTVRVGGKIMSLLNASGVL
jgi:putative transposase